MRRVQFETLGERVFHAFKGRHSLRTTLIIPFLILALLCSVFAAAFAAKSAQSSQAERAQRLAASSATKVAALGAELREELTRVNWQLQSVIVRDPQALRVNPESAALVATQLSPGARVVYASDDGSVNHSIAPGMGQSKALTVADSPIPQWRASAAQNAGALLIPVAPERGQAPTHFVHLSRITDVQSRPIAWAAWELPATALAEKLHAMTVPRGVTLALAQADGTPIAASSPPPQSAARLAAQSLPVAGGVNWLASAEVDRRSVSIWSAPWLRALIAALVTFATVGALGALVLNSIVRDFNDLTRATERFQMGQSLESLPLRRSDEIGRLARAFASMSDHATLLLSTERSRTEIGDVIAQAQQNALSEQRVALARARDQVQRYAAVVEAAYEGIAIVDRRGRIDFVNPAFAAEFRMPASALIGTPIGELFHAESTHTPNLFQAVLESGIVVRETIRCKRSDSSDLYAELTASPIRDDEGVITSMVVVERDVTDSLANNAAISKQLLIDPLTDVWRRSALLTDLERRAGRAEESPFSVLFIDLDGFKAINDQFGHEAGDTVLRAVGTVLKNQIREHDAAGRYGGDEFVIVLDDDSQESNARRVAQRVIAAIPSVTSLRFPNVRFSASIGIACFPRDADTVQDVLRCADHAMYVAKRAGGGRSASWQTVQTKPSWSSAPPRAEVLTLRRRS